MSHANLTARYRPQKFSELAGQETIRAILSRAAAEDKVAPAYLFSGTRGVGKTTVARVFAKALNCAHAPAAEPCNQCDRCRQITLGTSVDVVEIDGASNRGIDDVRKLKEVVGYAPMEGRYRVFIIDEAHMLSRDAFNALLKTLEEPPANVTFIMATTEPHKFPATIISRCQHYVFKRLPEHGLEAHLTNVLSKENVPFEEGAIRLIARRAAGSVRDAMSLLGQVLALGGESLTEKDTRMVLGLAGQELFFSLFATLREGNGASVTRMVSEMLDSGLDLGFFLREMALCWRNMFILRQSGDAALSVLDIPEKEAVRWKEEAERFDLAHIHAAWQMTIDGQRRVLTSLEPALALELLLLNIAMLPKLLPLEGLARFGRAPGGAQSGTGQTPAVPASNPATPPSTPPSNSMGASGVSETGSENASPEAMPPFPVTGSEVPDLEIHEEESFARQAAVEPEERAPEIEPRFEARAEAFVDSDSLIKQQDPSGAETETTAASEDMGDTALASDAAFGEDSGKIGAPLGPPDDVSWSAFLRFCKNQQELSPAFAGMIRTVTGEWRDYVMELTPGSEFSAERLQSAESHALVSALVREYYGGGTVIKILPPPKMKTASELREELRENPSVKLLEKELGARLIDYGLAPAKAPVDTDENDTNVIQ